MEDFNINDNNIEKIPEELYECKNLKKLHLGLNYIQKISKNILKLTKLEELGIEDNEINEAPLELMDLENLKFVII